MTATEQDWRAVADRYWDTLLELEPILGTEVGDERFDDRLPDPSEAGRAHREKVQRRALEEAATVDRTGLDMVGRTTLDLIEAIARRDLASIEHRLDRLSAVSHLWGPGSLLADIASLQRADTPERADRYLGRLASGARLSGCPGRGGRGGGPGRTDRSRARGGPVDLPGRAPHRARARGRAPHATCGRQHGRHQGSGGRPGPR